MHTDQVNHDEGLPSAAVEIKFTVLMPCLNEAETIGACIAKALNYFAEHNVRGEIIVADNGSTDGSQGLAEQLGARVIHVSRRGYGAALIAGIEASHGEYIIMGDSDGTYDFSHLEAFVDRLRAGADLVLGNRFNGGHQAWSHAMAASLSGESSFEFHRPTIIQCTGGRFSLRIAWLQNDCHAQPWTANDGNGICERDDCPQRAGWPQDRGGADYFGQSWPRPTAASEDMARRLAPIWSQ
jgi:glycosyltransferase involved in cell wall biosynthesis